MKTETPQLLTVEHIRAILGNPSHTTLWRWCREGTIPRPIKVGGLRLWDAAELSDFIERRLAARNVKGA